MTQIRNIEQIRQRQIKDQQEIDKGTIEHYIRTTPLKLGAIDIAMALNLNTQLVRHHLEKLAKEKKVFTRNKKYQNKLNSEGLYYAWNWDLEEDE